MDALGRIATLLNEERRLLGQPLVDMMIGKVAEMESIAREGLAISDERI